MMSVGGCAGCVCMCVESVGCVCEGCPTQVEATCGEAQDRQGGRRSRDRGWRRRERGREEGSVMAEGVVKILGRRSERRRRHHRNSTGNGRGH